ncbi:MAG: ABC transporter ATP-binding protein [Planctomycetota bacterium]|nr:ABC transporter ATP-binding protein [Planctomycetota bacterium]
MVVNNLHTESEPMIELRRIHRFFGNTKAVNDISFEVYRGQVFGFIGPNGAGKTTSMRILSTLELPSYGDAFVDGFSVINDPDLVRRRLGFMPDGFSMYQNMNCVEYLDFFARSYGLLGKDRIAALRRTLSFTGLDKIAAKPITGLSKGMRQRLCLGRAMIHSPSVLILDEPANGLDPRARIELRQMIQQLAVEGTSILVSSHILTELAEMCDQVGIIERGRLLAVGSVAEIRRTIQGALRVEITAVDKGEQLQQWLSIRPGVSRIKRTENAFTLDLEGGPAEQAVLLKDIVQAEFSILEYAAHRETLEDVFMKITTGAVQ